MVLKILCLPVDAAQLEKKLNEARKPSESVQEHAAAEHQPDRRWPAVSASERTVQALVHDVGDDVSLQQIEELNELAGLNDERPVECVAMRCPRRCAA